MPIELRETEGVKIGLGYMQPLYHQPIFREKTAYGNTHYPFSETVEYTDEACPVCEKVCNSETIFHELMRPYMTKEDLDDVVEAFHKVADNLDELR